MKFSVVYQPVNLFSLKESNFTNSGAKSLFLPSPYSIKMAVFNQAITLEGKEAFEEKKSKELSYIKDAKISYYVTGSFCVNNCFVIIQSLRDGVFRGKPSFREYIYLTDNIEIIFEVADENTIAYLQKYLYRINYWGKRGCFFQFVEYKNNPNEPNVKIFDVSNTSMGILQEFDDMQIKADFKNIDNFDSTPAKRERNFLVLPITNINSSKSYTHYRCL
jgi:hypothetical protein